MFRAENRWMNVLSWLHSVLLFSCFYIVLAGVFTVSEGEAIKDWLGSLWLLVPIITSWLCIRKLKSFLGYLVVGIAVVGLMALITGNLLTLVFSLMIFVIRGYVRVIRGKMNDQELPGEMKEVELWEIPTVLDKPQIFHWILFVIGYFVLIYLELDYLLKWLFTALVMEIFITYIYGSLQQMTTYVTENCHIAHLPVKAIQRMQRAVLGITLAILVMLVLPSVFYGKEPLIALREIDLNWELQVRQEQEQENLEMMDPGEAMREMFGEEVYEPNVVLQTILNIITWVVGITGSIVAIWAVGRICRNLMNSFENGQDADVIISLDDKSESLVTKIRRTRKERDFKSTKQKIRKSYKKVIKKNLKGKPAGWETPEELEEKAGLRAVDISKEFHEIYEKARYSQYECDDNDLEKIKRGI